MAVSQNRPYVTLSAANSATVSNVLNPSSLSPSDDLKEVQGDCDGGGGCVGALISSDVYTCTWIEGGGTRVM